MHLDTASDVYGYQGVEGRKDRRREAGGGNGRRGSRGPRRGGRGGAGGRRRHTLWQPRQEKPPHQEGLAHENRPPRQDQRLHDLPTQISRVLQLIPDENQRHNLRSFQLRLVDFQSQSLPRTRPSHHLQQCLQLLSHIMTCFENEQLFQLVPDALLGSLRELLPGLFRLMDDHQNPHNHEHTPQRVLESASSVLAPIWIYDGDDEFEEPEVFVHPNSTLALFQQAEQTQPPNQRQILAESIETHAPSRLQLPRFYQFRTPRQAADAAIARQLMRRLISKLLPASRSAHPRLNSPLWSLLTPSIDCSFNICSVREMLDLTEHPLDDINDNFGTTLCLCRKQMETCGCMGARLHHLTGLLYSLRSHLALSAELLTMQEHERRHSASYFFDPEGDVEMQNAYSHS